MKEIEKLNEQFGWFDWLICFAIDRFQVAIRKQFQIFWLNEPKDFRVKFLNRSNELQLRNREIIAVIFFFFLVNDRFAVLIVARFGYVDNLCKSKE